MGDIDALRQKITEVLKERLTATKEPIAIE